jgi:hypothetical protein
MKKPIHYRSYLLRLWRDHAGGTWRASLQSTATEQIQHFGDLHGMWRFLNTELMEEEGEPQSGDIPPPGPESGTSD